MQLMDSRVEQIIVEVTPEMRKRIRELNEQAMRDSLMLRKRWQQCGDLQGECMSEATRVDNISRYGTDNFYKEGSPKTKRKVY